VVDGLGDDVLGTVPGTLVVVVGDGVVVVVVVDEVVDVVVDEVVDVVDVVVVEGGDTPSITPPTVVPEAGPPKIDERDRPALSSTTVTRPRARTKAPRAEAAAIKAQRQRL